MKRWTISLLALCIGGLVACGEATEEPPPEPATSMTKEEAAALGGKGDHGDICAWFGWYGDGVCDDFCYYPDPDCAPDACEVDTDCGWGEICEAYSICDETECTPPLGKECFAVNCDDGSAQDIDCDIVPLCAPGQVAAVIEGCFECVDARTCQAPASEVQCGARLGDTCADDEFCDFSEQAMCGYADGTGVCTPRPEFCTQEYAPVCGCDGQTYSNDCNAKAARVDVYHAGPCMEPEPQPECQSDADCPVGDICNNGVCVIDAGPAPDTCGGFTGQTCAPGQYCDYEPPTGSVCGFADGTGTCKPRPEFCTEEYQPVCGCDGQTYSNDCKAAAAGVDVQSEGACG